MWPRPAHMGCLPTLRNPLRARRGAGHSGFRGGFSLDREQLDGAASLLDRRHGRFRCGGDFEGELRLEFADAILTPSRALAQTPAATSASIVTA